MSKVIKLKAVVDLTKQPQRVEVEGMGDEPWDDLGYWMEVTGFMAYISMRNKEWTPDRMADYVRDYIFKCLKGYKIKR